MEPQGFSDTEESRQAPSLNLTRQPLILNTATSSTTAAVTTETSRSHGFQRKYVGNMSPVPHPPGNKQEVGEAGGVSEMWWQQAG